MHMGIYYNALQKSLWLLLMTMSKERLYLILILPNAK
jgi:hypothetical protein